MKTPTLRTTILLSCLCGFLSGTAGAWVAYRACDRKAKEDGVLRARRIELTGAGGRVRGVWEVRDREMTSLQFFDQAGNPRVWLANDGGSQILAFNEEDGRVRVSLATNSTGMTALHLGDRSSGARVTLGALVDSDVPLSQPPETWGLMLRRPGPYGNYLSAWVKGKPRSGKEETMLRLEQGNGEVWKAP